MLFLFDLIITEGRRSKQRGEGCNNIRNKETSKRKTEHRLGGQTDRQERRKDKTI